MSVNQWNKFALFAERWFSYISIICIVPIVGLMLPKFNARADKQIDSKIEWKTTWKNPVTRHKSYVVFFIYRLFVCIIFYRRDRVSKKGAKELKAIKEKHKILWSTKNIVLGN